ncbi:polysaccharide deacetylase family protein [Streptomyces sp. NPDC008343]|uniref:polysaccharide deacetylase family protein n=1 Tax=Streptomyces sp. NPDC008343 TaxID=3364828 RepID=UPI0036EC4B6F
MDPAIAHSTGKDGNTVALTFDDGPDPRWTPQILSLLAQYHARATFCLIGPLAEAHPDLVHDIVAAGHRLCDHTVHHDEAMHALSPEAQDYEIAGAQGMIDRAAGGHAPLRYFRAPGGDFTPAIRQIAVRHGLRPLGWTVDAEDWKRPGVPAILSNVKSELEPGGIVLMHDAGGDRSQTVQALKELLPWLVASGYEFDFPEL